MKNKIEQLLSKKNQWVILLLFGILLVVIALPAGDDFNSDQTVQQNTHSTDVEQKLETMLSLLPGIGDVHLMITYDEEEQVEGIVVIAEGGGNAIVVRNVTEVVEALFHIESHKIKVMEQKKSD